MRNKMLSMLLTGVLALSVTACGQTGSAVSTETAGSQGTEAQSAEGFPMTIAHGLGETVIDQKPENIVAIAWGNPDVPLALGVVPAGISEANFGPRDENGLLAWTAKAYEDLGATPNVFNDTDGWDYEAISDCNPDVILAAYSGLSQEEYDRLSEIAPVVAYPTVPWTTTWQEETITDAKAMGMEKEGKALVEETQKLIDEKVASYPKLDGLKVAFFWLSEDDLGTFYIYTNNDPRAAFLGDLGFATPESLDALIEDPDAFSVAVSAENADVLTDVDVIITYGTESLVTAIQKDGRYANIPAVQNGAFVLLDSNDVLAAASTPTVLSIPYCIDAYLEALNEAAERVQ